MARAGVLPAAVALLLLGAACQGDDGAIDPPDGPDAGAVVDAGHPPDGGAGPSPTGCTPSAGELPADLARGSWDDAFFVDGLAGDLIDLQALAVDEERGRVYVGGDFWFAGPAFVSGLAVWEEGVGWAPVGDELAFGYVAHLALGRDGELYAGFQPWDGLMRIRRWDGASWQELGEVLGGLMSLAVDPEGRLVAGGGFRAIGEVAVEHLAIWDGAAWSGFAEAPNGPVGLVLADARGLCIGGVFDRVGELPAQIVACHDGMGWHARNFEPMDDGSPVVIGTLARDPEGELLLGGIFRLSGQHPGDGGSLARWTGERWQIVGGGLIFPSFLDPHDAGWVFGLAVVPEGLLVAGSFTKAGGIEGIGVRHVALWDGEAWRDVGGVTSGGGARGSVVRRVVAAGDGAFLLGAFGVLEETAAAGVARWTTSGFTSLGQPDRRPAGLNGSVHALTERDCQVYAGGTFLFAGDTRVNHVARFDPETGWHPLGEGLRVPVWALAVGADGTLYAGASSRSGSPTMPPVHVFAAWRDGAWREIDGLEGSIWTLALGSDGLLYAGGEITAAGGQPASGVATWDGDAWSALPDGPNGLVAALAAHPDGGVVVVGNFTRAGGATVNGVARWDGQAWSGYGSGLEGELLSVAVLDGQPLVGGHLYQGQGVVLARWTGAAWEDIGAPLATEGESTQVSDLQVIGDRVFAVGQFTAPGTWNWGGLGVLEEGAWRFIGGGLSMYSTRVLVQRDAIYAGGYFSGAGGRIEDEALHPGTPSRGLARFRFDEGRSAPAAR